MNSSVFIAEEQRPDLVARTARECWRMGMILEEMDGPSPEQALSSPHQHCEEGPNTGPGHAGDPDA
jgi:hypothetical protein